MLLLLLACETLGDSSTESVVKHTVLTCSEYANEEALTEDQIHSDKCTFKYVEIDEPNDIQIAPMITKDVDYDGNANDVDVSTLITTVHFSSSRLSRVPVEIFQKFTNLKALNCDGVNLQSLSRADMTGAANLKDFSCNSNYVKALDANVFMNSARLESIDISINDIENIDPTSFSGLSELKKLLLYDNKLSSLPASVFKDLINLEEINLSNNQIQVIDVELLSHCRLLKYIYLNDNLIRDIHESAFQSNDNIVFLEMSQNRLSSLKLNLSASGLYANNNQLQSIHLGSIGYLSFYNNSISSVVFTVPEDILSLNMSTNNLNGDSLHDIIRCSALKSLDLSFNNLGRLNVSTFLELNELQILNLQSTNLSRIDFGLFQHQTKLEQMDISYNQLGTSGEFDLNKFTQLKSLVTLFMEGNNISQFRYEDVKKTFPKLHTIGYSDNSWKCPYLILMNSFMESNGIEIYHLVTVKTRSNVGGIACDGDDNRLDSDMKYDDKLHSTNSIRHTLNAVGDNGLSVITKRFEEVLINISRSHSHGNDESVNKSELINELSSIKSSIELLRETTKRTSAELERLKSHGVETLIQNLTKDVEMMRKKLDAVESTLDTVKSHNKEQLERANKQYQHAVVDANGRDDFIVKAMISTIFVIVCGFVAVYIIKLLARRHHSNHRNLKSYTDGYTLDDNSML